MGLAGSVGAQGPAGVEMVSGALGAPRGCQGALGVYQGVGVQGSIGGWQGVWVLRGQQGYRWHWGLSGVSGGIGAVSCMRAGRECRCSGASRGRGRIRGHGGAQGCWGLSWGVVGALGWQVDWKPDHIGPQSRVPALPLVPLGE